jgi:hypothetical protein
VINKLSDDGFTDQSLLPHSWSECSEAIGKYKHPPIAPTQMRRAWLTALIREVHTASRGTYGGRRIHGELTLGMGVRVSVRLVAVLMSMNRIAGLPSVGKMKYLHGVVSPVI